MNKDFKDYQYSKNYLINVVFRLDFPDNLELVNQHIDSFRQAIKETFPVPETPMLTVITGRISRDENVSTRDEIPLYQFYNTNRDKIVELGHNHLSISFIKYKNLSEFNSCIQNVFDKFRELYKFDYSRFGVRYINQVVIPKGNPLNWKNLIDSSLTHVIDKYFDRDPCLSRIMSQVVLNRDEYKIIFNYGMVNSEFPAKISRKEFVLDYDCYTEYVESEKIMSLLGQFNEEIKIMFEKSIAKGLRSIMGVINE